MPSNAVSCLAIGPDNSKWIGLKSGKLLRLQDSTWTIYDSQTNMALGYSIDALSLDPQGNPVVGNFMGLTVFDGSVWTTYDYSGIWEPLEIVVDTNNVKWISTYRGGLLKFINGVFTPYNAHNSNYPTIYGYSIGLDAHDSVWVGTDAGILKFMGANFEIFSLPEYPLPHNVIRKINHDGNTLWIATSLGIVLYNSNGFANSVPAPLSGTELIKIYPNPIQDVVWIESLTSLPIRQLMLLDSHGRIIKKQTVNLSKTFLQMSSMPAGIYLLQITTNIGTSYSKIIKL